MAIVRPPFVPFDEHQAVRIYERNLPHWRQEGVTYFVTFREGDSIPAAVRLQWEEEKAHWLKARGIDYADEKSQRGRAALQTLAPGEQTLFERHFNRQVQSCLNRGLGSCSLRKPDCIEKVRARLLADDGGRYHLGDFVIMPNHVHVLIAPIGGEKLEVILKQIKGASAVDCNRPLGRSGTFWQAESYDHIVRTLEQLQRFRQYIADNPAKAGITLPDAARYFATWIDKWFKS